MGAMASRAEPPPQARACREPRREGHTGADAGRRFPSRVSEHQPDSGARIRFPEDWNASLEKMIELGPEHVVPGHTHPVLGAAAARAALTAYRDVIRSILDQTIALSLFGDGPAARSSTRVRDGVFIDHCRR